MDRDTAVQRMQDILGFRSDLDTKLVAALQDVQVELEKGRTLPWFLQSEVASISTVDGEERIKLPSDFIREWDDDPLWYFDASADEDVDVWTPLAKDDLESLRRTYPGEGTPRAYQLDVTYFRIFPTPDDTYTLKMIYYKKDDELTTNVENLWLEHVPYLLISTAGVLIAAGLRDQKALEIFSALEQKHHALMVLDTETRRHNSHRYIMGGPD